MNAGRLRSIFFKEFIQMRRDRGTLGLMLVVPVMQLLMFGYAIRMDVRNLPTTTEDKGLIDVNPITFDASFFP